jgi:hypothetical protein
VLNRLGYGGGAWSRARIDALGVHGYIEEQLSPATIDDSALDAMLGTKFASLSMDFNQLRTSYPADEDEARDFLRLPARVNPRTLELGRELRAKHVDDAAVVAAGSTGCARSRSSTRSRRRCSTTTRSTCSCSRRSAASASITQAPSRR